MGKIGEFLNNKPWHPSSRQNQTLLFEAEELDGWTPAALGKPEVILALEE